MVAPFLADKVTRERGDWGGGLTMKLQGHKAQTHVLRLSIRFQGMYNGAILVVPCRINDEVEERELIRKGLSYLI